MSHSKRVGKLERTAFEREKERALARLMDPDWPPREPPTRTPEELIQNIAQHMRRWIDALSPEAKAQLAKLEAEHGTSRATD